MSGIQRPFLVGGVRLSEEFSSGERRPQNHRGGHVPWNMHSWQFSRRTSNVCEDTGHPTG